MGRKEMPGASDSCAMGGGATRRDPNAVAAAESVAAMVFVAADGTRKGKSSQVKLEERDP